MNVVHNLRQAVEWYRGFIEEHLAVLRENREDPEQEDYSATIFDEQIKECEAALAVGKEIEEGKRKL